MRVTSLASSASFAVLRFCRQPQARQDPEAQSPVRSRRLCWSPITVGRVGTGFPPDTQSMARGVLVTVPRTDRRCRTPRRLLIQTALLGVSFRVKLPGLPQADFGRQRGL